MGTARQLTLLLLGAALAGCGQEQAAPAPELQSRVVTGSASKGPLQGASIDFYLLDAAGNPTVLAGVSPATTDANGNFTVSGLPAGVPVLASTNGGFYIDESDPEPNPALRRRVDFNVGGGGLNAVLPPNATTIAITPYSAALYLKAKNQNQAAGGTNFANTYAAVRTQATSAFGFDPITTLPANPVSPAAAASLAARQYALLLGASALAINQIAVTGTPEHLPGFLDINAFINDFADGRLDVASLDELVRRFRNNNIGVYGSTPAPSVNETALSQPAVVPNAAPVITGLSGTLSTSEDVAITLTLADLTVTDPDDSYPSDFTLTVLPGANYTFSGAMVTPALNFNGTLSVAVRVNDGQADSNTFNASVTVTPVADPPTNTLPGAQTVAEDTTTPIGGISVADPEGNLATSQISVSLGTVAVSLSGGATISAGANNSPSLTLAGTQAQINAALMTLTYRGNLDATGSDSLILQSIDATSLSDVDGMGITITPVNDPPTISDVTDQVIDEDTDTGTLAFTVGDPETPAGSLTVNKSTSNPTLVPPANIVLGGSGPSRTVVVTPAGDLSGTATITLTVSDGALTAQDTFLLTVNPVDDPPSLDVNSVLTVSQGDTATITTGFLSASDIDSANSAIAFDITTPPANGTIEVMGVPASGFSQADLVLGLVSYAHDGSATSSDSFEFTLSDAGGFSADCPSPSPCTFGIIVTPAGAAESVLPYLTGTGELTLVDPADPSNPILLETGVSLANFAARTLLRAEVSAAVASNIRPARLLYVKDGTLRRVNLEAGQGHGSFQVSNIADACRINGVAEDFANPDNSMVRIDTAGADGICDSGDEFSTANAWLVPLTTPASSPGVSIGFGNCCGITGIGDSNGALQAVLTTEDDGSGSTFELRRRNVGALGSPVSIATLDIGGQGRIYAHRARSLGETHIYIRARVNGDVHYKLHRVNTGSSALTPLFDYGTGDATTFTGDFDASTHDANDFFFTSTDGASLLKVPHSATGEGETSTLATGSPSAPIQDLVPTATQLVFERSGLSNGGVFSVPKSGGTGATLGANDDGPTVVRLAGVNGERVFLDKVSGVSVPTYTAWAVDADGSNPLADIDDAHWAGSNAQPSCDFNLTCEDALAAQYVFLRRQASTSNAELELADPLTGAPLGTYLGTVFNVASGLGVSQAAFAFGFGRYAQVTVFAAIGQTDLFLGDGQLASAAPPPQALATIANDPGAGNNFWLTFGFEDQGGGGGTPEAFNWSLVSVHDGGAQGDDDSIRPVLSGNGRYVVFESRATTLVSPGPPPGVSQIYRRDLLSNATELVSMDSGQAPGSSDSTDPAVSHDGRFIAFRTQAPELIGSTLAPQVVLIDMNQPGNFRLVSDACNDSCEFDSTQGRITMSTDGRFVAFLGSDNNLTPPAPDNNTVQAYRADVQTGDVLMVSVDADDTARCGQGGGCASVTMSGDGRWVAWSTEHASLPGDGNGLSDVLLRDLSDGSLRLVSGFGGTTLSAASAQPFISADGSRLAFETEGAFTPFDTNGGADIYVYDIAADSLARASAGPGGEQGQGVGFAVSAGEDAFGAPVLSGDGRYLLFTADEDTLATPQPAGSQTSPYLKELASIAANGSFEGNLVRAYANDASQLLDAIAFGRSLDFTGERLTMDSGSTNAVAGDANGFIDAFAASHPQFQADLFRDTDLDGLTDAIEASLGTNPLLRDTDGDGASDFDELNRDGDSTSYLPGVDSDPLLQDTDGDDVADGVEDGVGSDPVAVANVALRVRQFSGNDVECDGSTWDDYPGGSGPLACALQSSSGALARLPPSVFDAANTVFVLYEGGGSDYGQLTLTGPARQFVAFVGSLGPGRSVPTIPESSTFSAGGGGSAVEVSNAQHITIAHFAITNGNAPNGGGVLVHDVGGTPIVTLDRVNVHSNVASGNGGGVALIGVNPARLTVKRSVIAANSVSSASTAYGGGAYASGGRLELFDSVIEANTATGLSVGVGQGGGLYATSSSTVVIEKTRLLGNTASSLASGSRGGGIYVGFATVLTVRDSLVAGNRVLPGGAGQASFGGGGLWAGPGDSVNIENTIFADNHAANGPGGGVNFFDTNFITVSDSRFLSNSSSGFPGGGFHMHVGGGNSDIFNNLFVGNHSDVTDPARPGGGVEIENFQSTSVLHFDSNTVAYNQIQIAGTGASGGLNISVSTPANNELRNNNIWFNDNADVGGALQPGDNVVLDDGGGPPVAVEFGVQDGNNVNEPAFPGTTANTDPQFTQGFFLAQGSSPSVDGGDDLFDNLFGTLFAYTTDPAGVQDLGQVDIGFHHRGGAVGGLNAVKNVVGSTCVDVPQVFKFVPVFAGAPSGDPGHLIVVEISGVTNTLASLTTLDPRASGSRIARDLGDGSYAITVNDDGGGGPATFSVYADDQLTPRSFLVSLITGCS